MYLSERNLGLPGNDAAPPDAGTIHANQIKVARITVA